MHWFGESWGAPVCKGKHIPTPVCALCCGSCGGVIKEGDQGVVLPFLGYDEDNHTPDAAYHLVCFLRSILADCPQCRQPRPFHKMDCSLRSADLKAWDKP